MDKNKTKNISRQRAKNLQSSEEQHAVKDKTLLFTKYYSYGMLTSQSV